MKAIYKDANGLNMTVNILQIDSFDAVFFEIEMEPQQLAQAHIEALPMGASLRKDSNILILPKSYLIRVLRYN